MKCAETTCIQLSINIDQDLLWNITVHGKLKVIPDSLMNLPLHVSSLSVLIDIVTFLNGVGICTGNPDSKFACLATSKHGVFHGMSGKMVLIYQ